MSNIVNADLVFDEVNAELTFDEVNAELDWIDNALLTEDYEAILDESGALITVD